MLEFIRHKLTIVLLSFSFYAIIINDCKPALSVDEIKNIDPHISQYFRNLINEAWSYSKKILYDSMKTNLDKGDTYVLYNIQIYTNNLLRYCFFIKDYEILNDLVEINLLSYEYLVVDKDGYKKWIYTYADNPEFASLIGKEFQLPSIQYIYLISKMINIITSIDRSQRTSKMDEFINKFSPVVIKEHYLRWLPVSTLSLERKLKRWYSSKFSNAVNDKDLQLIGGVAEILSANQKDPHLVPLTSSQKESMLYFIDLASKLLESRITESELTDFEGKKVKGCNFDLGAWDEYPDYSYSGYTGATFPTEADKKANSNVGWDISHARRFVHVFDTLYESRSFTNQNFPDEKIMIGFANQVIYGVFNKDFNQPLFTNFMDGTNGWYRVNYANRENFGYGPYKLSNSIPTGGYGFWSRYNQDMIKVMNAFWNMIKRSQIAKSANDRDRLIHKEYYGSGYYNISGNPLNFLMFLPSMVSFYSFEKTQELNFNPGWNLFSINLVVSNNNINSILEPIKGNFSSLYTYDNINKFWLVYFPDYPHLSDISTVDLGRGYWIYMNTKKNLTIRGTVPKDRSVKLKSGWNLVGYNSSEYETVLNAMFTIYEKYLYIYTYDSEKGWMVNSNDKTNTPIANLEILIPGSGYWVFVKEDCIWDLCLFF